MKLAGFALIVALALVLALLIFLGNRTKARRSPHRRIDLFSDGEPPA